jgi:hypothetical protein
MSSIAKLKHIKHTILHALFSWKHRLVLTSQVELPIQVQKMQLETWQNRFGPLFPIKLTKNWKQV